MDALQAQIGYWRGTVVTQPKKLVKYSGEWWEQFRQLNKGSSGLAEQKLFEEYKKQNNSGSTVRKPSW
jgi:hypothetical protein